MMRGERCDVIREERGGGRGEGKRGASTESIR